ncbi:MAG: thiopurine S-methyltransferase [Hyphomicrobiales bacterium]|nr:thiopurine S-methyltransferase [Hyphomicrobiales bacterium]PCJ93138.1 MAG: thiopurine S-methyltransferase [Hyphomicrobiales bacterium]
MDEEFWQSRWRENRTGFHEEQPNDLLVNHIHHLNLQEGDAVFVPLCGKTIDLDWLLSQKIRVIGAEFSAKAVEAVFARQNLIPDITSAGSLLRYSGGSLVIFVGDIFKLDAESLGKVDAVYDRAALVALPPATRAKYAPHMINLTNSAPQLLIAFDYDQQQMDGPPFSVPGKEIQHLYEGHYKLEALASQKISGRLSERCQGDENTWLLKPK